MRDIEEFGVSTPLCQVSTSHDEHVAKLALAAAPQRKLAADASATAAIVVALKKAAVGDDSGELNLGSTSPAWLQRMMPLPVTPVPGTELDVYASPLAKVRVLPAAHKRHSMSSAPAAGVGNHGAPSARRCCAMRITFTRVFLLITTLLFASSIAIVWYTSYIATLAIVRDLSTGVRSALFHSVCTSVSSDFSVGLRALRTLQSMVRDSFPDIATRQTITNTTGYLAAVSYAALNNPSIKSVGFVNQCRSNARRMHAHEEEGRARASSVTSALGVLTALGVLMRLLSMPL
jgi:hypothetical protein